MNMVDSLYRFECADSYCTAVGLKKQLSIREKRGSEACRLRCTQKGHPFGLLRTADPAAGVIGFPVWLFSDI